LRVLDLKKTEAPKKDRKVLILTGRLCENAIRELIGQQPADVLALPIDVASLMTTHLALQALNDVDLSPYQLVLVPGAASMNLNTLEERFGIPFRRGPFHYRHLAALLAYLPQLSLSKDVPADLLMTKQIRRQTLSQLATIEKRRLSQATWRITIGSGKTSLTIFRGCLPRVIAEITNAPQLGVGEITRIAKYYRAQGADLIDIGMSPNEENVDFLKSALPALKSQLDVPISVDTAKDREILAAADLGADLILSLCASNIELAESLDIPFVVVPLERPDRSVPRSPAERVSLLEKMLCRIQQRYAILDPVLEPVGLGHFTSLLAYADLYARLPDAVTLMGVGNATEMIDADSIGINALMAGIASELGVSLLLTTESSRKTHGAVSELVVARNMTYFSTATRTPPKNIGINLLRYKEKIDLSTPVNLPENALLVKADSSKHASPEIEKQVFSIWIAERSIHVTQVAGPQVVDIEGPTADAILDKLDQLGLLPSARHSAYIGYELAKAEIALATGRSYVQDYPLFEGDQ